MANKKKVCKDCGALTTDKACEVCKSTNLADKYKGMAVVFDAKESEIGKKLNIEKEGSYAIKY